MVSDRGERRDIQIIRLLLSPHYVTAYTNVEKRGTKMQMTLAQMLENGALEAELRRRLRNADPYEAQDIEYALQFTKAMQAGMAKSREGTTGPFMVDRATMTRALATAIWDEPITELMPLLGAHSDLIEDGSLETELQNRIVQAGKRSDYEGNSGQPAGSSKCAFSKLSWRLRWPARAPRVNIPW